MITFCLADGTTTAARLILQTIKKYIKKKSLGKVKWRLCFLYKTT